MSNREIRLPGRGMGFLSVVPTLNWIPLVYIGAINSNPINIICGLIYGIVTYSVPSLFVPIWILCVVHYSISYKITQSKANNSLHNQAAYSAPPTTLPRQKYTPRKQFFSDMTLSGESERRQSIPARTVTPTERMELSFSTDRTQNSFFRDMQKYAAKNGALAKFEPFMTYWPTYNSMNKQQQAWYFYWRTQVRNGNYPDTDLSYIFVHIYELLSGVGWESSQDGYNQLLNLWSAYRESFPKLDHYLHHWVFDFAYLHNLEHATPLGGDSLHYGPSAMTDILISRHADEVPLKLPFVLIDSLCDYSLVNSKFYKDGKQNLMQEAIPRVVALADASLRRRTQKGILATYGPNRPKKQEYYAFRSAVCHDANKRLSVSIKAYSSNTKLRGYINELVRYAENSMRALHGYRGRLRGVLLDEETSNLVEAFLKREYNKPANVESKLLEKTGVSLDFESISALREQSDAVRNALHVEEATVPVQKELLTDIQEVTAIYVALSYEARQLLDRLQTSNWTCEQNSTEEPVISEINRLSEYYLGGILLVKENDMITAEDDYRDELEHIYNNPPQIPGIGENISEFNVSILTPELRDFVNALVPEQKKALYAVLTQEYPQNELDQIADEAMTMPQMLLDDINETALQILGDIVVDSMSAQPHILDEYVTLLKQSIA